MVGGGVPKNSLFAILTKDSSLSKNPIKNAKPKAFGGSSEGERAILGGLACVLEIRLKWGIDTYHHGPMHLQEWCSICADTVIFPTPEWLGCLSYEFYAPIQMGHLIGFPKASMHLTS